MNKSQISFVLTEFELSSVRELGIQSPCKVLQNGIKIGSDESEVRKEVKRVVFCSRLEKRKGVLKFVELADYFRDSEIRFEIFGPDGGELHQIDHEIRTRNLISNLEYKGSLRAENVQEMLRDVAVLVLPSKAEPFPMVILEALSVGTPVIVMPSCGFADRLEKFEPKFVAKTEDLSGLIEALIQQISANFLNKSRFEIINFCRNEFGISRVTDQLTGEYLRVINHEE
jgi:glycosyltransferase involved in cell wall biosynthesis